MSDSPPHRLLLTPFEEYMLLDDRPAYPMTGLFRLRFSTHVNVSLMQAAVCEAMQRNPLLCSPVCGDEVTGFCWDQNQPRAVRLEEWTASGEREYPQASYLDLTRSAGTRMWLVDRGGAHDLVVQAHHACSDALGLCQLIEDLLIFYAQRAGMIADHIQLRPVDPHGLSRRGQFRTTRSNRLRLLLRQLLWLPFVSKFLFTKAVPLQLVPGEEASGGPPEFPSTRTYTFSRTATTRLLHEAKRRKVTLNDLVARDLFLAIDAWRRRHGAGPLHQWIRFFVPTNQRTAEHASMSAANVIGAVFVERNAEQLADPERLLSSIQREMNTIKCGKMGMLFLAAQFLLRKMPGLRNHLLNRSMCYSSCVFSNLGIILAQTPLPRQDGQLMMGDAALEGVDFIAPLRPLTAAAFCVYTYADRFFVNLHFDPRAFSKSQADDLLNCLVERICTSCESDCESNESSGGMRNRHEETPAGLPPKAKAREKSPGHETAEARVDG